MLNIQITDYSVIIAFFLVFSRTLTIIMLLPLFDNNSVPPMVKVLVTLLISYAFFPHVQSQVLRDVAYAGVDKFWLLTAFYTLTGLVIGFFLKSIMNIYIAAGSLITQQIGFAAVRYFDPSTSSQIGPFEKIISWTIIIIVINSGAILPMFKGIFVSFSTIHMYDLGNLGANPVFFLKFFKSIFMSALMLASPLVFTNMFIMAVLGIVARMVPQMNIIMVSFVVNIGLGLLVFSTISEEFFTVAYRMYVVKLGEWFQLIS